MIQNNIAYRYCHFRRIELSIYTVFLSFNGTEVAVDQEPFQFTCLQQSFR